MDDQGRAPRTKAVAEEVLDKVGIYNNPYLKALRDGSMSLEHFRRTQEQFYWAVAFFSRPMSTLIARIPDPKARLDILHNVVEEHGEFHEGEFHGTTFDRFLKSIGSETKEEDRLPLWPEVRAFNGVVIAACALDELEVGVACMGVIEHAFAEISSQIGRAVVERGWVAEDDLVHYKLHAEIDERHAEEFFAVIEPSWDDDKRGYFTRQGLELGAYSFDRFYRDMHEHEQA